MLAGVMTISLANLDDPREAAELEAWIAAHPASTPFHRPAWIGAVARGTGQQALMLVSRQDGAIAGVLPLNLIHSPLFGRALVSSGFAVDGGILADDRDVAEALAGEDPEVRYANLAIRGRKLADIVAEQVPAAVQLAPDLVSLAGGVNDALRRHWDLTAMAGALESGVRDLAAAGADVVIVTSAELRPAAERLAAFDRQRGYQARVVEFQDVVDEFNHGIYHPRAVPAMLAWAQANWPDPTPRFLTLFGDGHWNFKNYNPALYPPQPQHIPPYLAWVDPTQGEVPADPWYGDLDGDRLPDLAVGRIAVNSLDEANAVLDKLEGYDESGLAGPWQQNAIFIADDKDSAGDFAALSDAIIADYLPAWFTPERLYLKATLPDAAAARTAIGAAIDAGALLLQYTGHGSPSRWTHEEIWTLADVPGLQNGPRLPVVMTFNCLDGYFAHPQPDLFSLAETMQRQPNGGSIAAISPSGLGFTFDQDRYRRLLMQSLFHDGVYTLGDALLRTQQRFFARTGPHYLIDTMMLYGDPTLHMPLPDEQIFMPLVW